MTGRRAILVCASIAAGLALIELLVSISGVKWADVLARFAVLDWVVLPRLAALSVEDRLALETWLVGDAR